MTFMTGMSVLKELLSIFPLRVNLSILVIAQICNTYSAKICNTYSAKFLILNHLIILIPCILEIPETPLFFLSL